MSDGGVEPRTAGNRPREATWIHPLALAVMAGTFLLILAGGNVTSKDAGLAVPDWPLSFGSVNPQGWTRQPYVRDEHGHRLIGAAVGLMVTALLGAVLIRDSRRPLKALAAALWLGIVLQGLMGGLRVTEKSVHLAMAHGVFAQVVLGMVTAVATMTSPRWRLAGTFDPVWPATCTQDRALRLYPLLAIACLFVQLVLGVILRHRGGSWIPHAAWAMVVMLALLAGSYAIMSHPRARHELSYGAISLLLTGGVQLLLGLVTLMIVVHMKDPVPATTAQAVVPTLHLGVGAALLAMSVHVAMMAWRLASSATGATAAEHAAVGAEART